MESQFTYMVRIEKFKVSEVIEFIGRIEEQTRWAACLKLYEVIYVM